MNNIKPAVIWARVSTTGQAETSLPSQVSRCKEKLEQAGYSVIQTFQVDWTSMDLYSCPEFQQLREMIKNRQIQAIAVYDRDRLEAKGLQRLIFLSELKDAGIELIVCNGAPMIDGPEGQIVELALAIGKERQVMRARQGSKDGLHDRIVKTGKPATFRDPYGYTWNKPELKLIPNENYPNAKLIFDMVLQGNGYTPIIKELARRGVVSPSGMPEWGKVAISQIIHNPIYAGRYFGLKKLAIEPKKRRTNSYGNSSVKRIPLTNAHYMPNIEIVDPPITWTQRAIILDQLERHQKLASRNAKRDYLLRGMVFCETHKGKNGEPRAYHGQPYHKKWRYSCPVGGCDHNYIDGRDLERFITLFIWNETAGRGPDGFHQALLEDQKPQKTSEILHKELDKLQKEDDGIVTKLAGLEERKLEGLEIEVYQKLRTKLDTRRKLIKERQDAILGQVSNLANKELVAKTLDEMYHKWNKTILVARKPWAYNWPEIPEENRKFWRDILSVMNIKIFVYPDDAEGPGIREYKFKSGPIKLKITGEIPFTEIQKENSKIAKVNPGDELRNQQYFPVRFTADVLAGVG